MFFHPCRDVRQAAWDPCSYRWIIRSKWEIQLCVICIAMVGETMCFCMMGPSDVLYVEKRRGPRTDPWGTPVTSWLCFGYLPSPGHLKRPTSEIGLLKGFRRLNAPCNVTVPTWYLSTVLRALKSPPFEQLQSVDLRPLTLKTPLLLALPSVKRMGDLQALSVSPSCLEFGPNDSKIILKPRHGYIPKVFSTPFRAQMITL